MLGRQMPFLSKIKTKNVFGLTGTVDLWPGHPKHSQNHPGLAEGQPEGPSVQGNLASQIKINTKNVFWPDKKVDFVAWPPNIAKITQDLLKANQKDHRSKEIVV